MKTRSKGFGTHLPAVRLYLDDIEDIAQQIRAAGFNPRFADDEYEFSDLEEFIKVRGAAPSNFEVGADISGLRIEVHRWNFLSTGCGLAPSMQQGKRSWYFRSESFSTGDELCCLVCSNQLLGIP